MLLRRATVLYLALLIGCSQQQTLKQDPNVVATVNGEVIPKADFELELGREAQAMEGVASHTPEQIEPYKQTLLTTMVERLVLLQAARATHIDVTQEEVDRRMGYPNVSDAMMVELTMLDLSVQCVLGCVGSQTPAFSQGAFHDFRKRLIEHDMDQRLLGRTVELARATGDFDAKKLPKTLRLGIDSSPLEGAGRVEDTLNLLGHAGRDIARCVAKLLGESYESICEQSGATLLLEASVKKGLDLDWTKPGVRDQGLRKLMGQLDSLVGWVKKRLPAEIDLPPLSETLA